MPPGPCRACLLLTAALAAVALVSCKATPSSELPPADRLSAAGAVMEAELAAPQSRAFSVFVERGDFVHLRVDQQGVDVVARLFDPRGEEVLQVDSPNGARGPEHVFAVATQTGEHRLVLEPWRGAGAGRFRLELVGKRPATPEDERRAAAAQKVWEGDRAVDRGSAVPSYQEALDLWVTLGEPYLRVITLAKLGSAWRDLGEMERAAECFEDALTSALALDVHDPEPSLFNELGSVYRRQGKPDEARRATEQALAASRDLGNLREETVALNDLALLLRSSGQTWKALDLYEQARAGFAALGDRAAEAVAWLNIGALYGSLEYLPPARDALKKALQLAEAAEDEGVVASVLTVWGTVETWAGDRDLAIDMLNRALVLRRRLGERSSTAGTLDRLGTAYLEDGRPREALAAYEESLALSRDLADPMGEAHTRDNLGETWLALGEPATARRHLDRALDLHRQTKDLPGEAHALGVRARASIDQEDLPAACDDLARALRLFEQLRSRIEGPDLGAVFLASVYDHYELYVDVLMGLEALHPGEGFREQALEAVERGRARSLLDLVGEAHRRGARQDTELESRLGEVGRRLRQRAGERRRRFEAGAPAPEIEALDAEIRTLLREQEKLTAEGRSRPAAAVKLPEPLDLEGLRGLLDEETSLVVYALGESRSWAWVLGPEGLASQELRPREEIEAAVLRLHGLLSTRPRVEGGDTLRFAAEAVSELLLEPIAAQLATPRLVVVPDGVLHYLPFPALPLPGRPAGDEAPVIREHEVVMLPSGSVLAALRREVAGRPPAPHLLAVMADPVFRRDDPRLTDAASAAASGSTSPDEEDRPESVPGLRSADDLGLDWMDRLPHTRREAESLLTRAPAGESWAALGFEARREAVTGGRLAPFRILHFATHAVLVTEHPALSGIALSLVDPEGRSLDGFLRAWEIAGLDLPAELVVLSACRTALGQEVRGEGMVGLPHSFLHAGAARVVTSLWNVDDRATADLMDRFYGGLLEEGLAPAAALRSAQLSLLDEGREPYFWAAFVLVGEWRDLRR